MQFCTLNEAWGNTHTQNNKQTIESLENTSIQNNKHTIESLENTPIQNNKQSHNNKQKMETNIINISDSSDIETFINSKKKNKKYYTATTTDDSYYENFTDTINDSKERNKIINKVLKSRRCRDILRNKFRPNLINKLIILFDDYRDVFVLILIGFCFIIFFNLLCNLNKK
jgi:hypothetical protein